MNTELQRLYEEDQRDREQMARGGAAEGVSERDHQRRKRVEDLLEAGEVREGIDYFNTAPILQHGEVLEDFRRAHELAKKTAQMGHRPGRWLAAAAYDRWLMMQGKPQRYGTQFFSDGERWRSWDVDPKTTDADRAEWDVPPIAEIQRRMCEAYGDPSPVDIDRLPDWIRDALKKQGS